MDEQERRLAEAIMSRMPSTHILRTMHWARAKGADWDTMQELCDEALGNMDASPEGKRYYQRALIATAALECGGANN